jgi:hypothetical protein
MTKDGRSGGTVSSDDAVDLPLSDYDALGLAELRVRVRGLDAGQLRVLLGHEHSHADRSAVLELLRTRLDELVDGARPVLMPDSSLTGMALYLE